MLSERQRSLPELNQPIKLWETVKCSFQAQKLELVYYVVKGNEYKIRSFLLVFVFKKFFTNIIDITLKVKQDWEVQSYPQL